MKKYSEKFHEIMQPGKNIKADFKPAPQNFRCAKGMPSFRTNDYIFVSKRVVTKSEI